MLLLLHVGQQEPKGCFSNEETLTAAPPEHKRHQMSSISLPKTTISFPYLLFSSRIL